ncbi:MAG: DUF1501 domain-containing protein [Planctomycetales bacterium]|nr:DUF1501 domain-containing protein [Planctomycetales bacterium]
MSTPEIALLDRRHFLRRSGAGLGTIGLAQLMASETTGAGNTPAPRGSNPLTAKSPHFPAKAQRVIHIFLNGGPSHVDTFDPKPELTRRHGQRLPQPNLLTERQTGTAMGSPFRFRRYGESGIEVSEIFAEVGAQIDDVCVVRSMMADFPNHEPSLMLMNCGVANVIRPSFGSWLTYGLGSENQNLPGFFAMSPGGYPIKGTENWQSAFLPSAYQGTFVDTQRNSVDKLLDNIRNPRLDTTEQRRQLDTLQQLNRLHAEQRDDADLFVSRIQLYEQAFRMQAEASEAFDLSREPAHIHKLYGSSVQCQQILIARRLVERGVRFVQLWHGAGQPWDNHDNIEANHRRLARECSQGIGALLSDLKQRGMLESTLVIIGGEFGRTPTVELDGSGTKAKFGRDHNHYGFSVCLAGGGIKGGTVYGATDEFGFRAAENPVHVHDLHATLLQLLGFDHTRLTFRHAGRDFRLTDVHGRVIPELLA